MRLKIGLLLILLSASYFTIWKGHNEPDTLIWDEHFHIASAQKYLHGVYFQEPHPPLGKLLIALGEYISAHDVLHSEFLKFDRAPHTPDNFHIEGYRLMPTLFTMAAPLALFDLLLLITANAGLSFLVALFLVLDLAFSTHSRVAHLEAFQILFFLVALSSFLRARSAAPEKVTKWSILFGIFFGLAAATKVTSLLIAPLFLIFPGSIRERIYRPIFAAASAALVMASVFYVHFWLGRNVHPDLDSKGYYGAPEEIRPIIAIGVSPTTFPIFLSEWVRFFKQYEKGVPKLNLCKNQENGSSPLIWPMGGGAISYSWKRDGELTRYVQLLVNPAVWAISLSGFLLGLMFLFQRVYSESRYPKEFLLSEIITLLYICYYAVMFQVERVMYLYHAFIPMILGLVLFGINAGKIEYLFGSSLNKLKKYLIGAILLALALASYLYFSPLATYQPISEEDFNSRKWLSIWNLKCADCASENPFARPIIEAEQKSISNDYWKVEIDKVMSLRVEQEWGEPKANLDVDGKPIVIGGIRYDIGIGTHARSAIDFIVPDGAIKFETLVGVPDQESANLGSVIFEVKVNSDVVFTSKVMRSGEQALPISIPVKNGDRLELFAYDAGDGNSHDHACWVNSHFII